jgi:hypothetical protein
MFEMNKWSQFLKDSGMNIVVTTNPKFPAIIGASHIEYNEGRRGIRKTENPFTIYLDSKKWICNLGGPGQMYTIIHVSDSLEDACKSIIGYLELIKSDKSVPAKLLIKLWKLQERGYTISLLNHEHIVVQKNDDGSLEQYGSDHQIVLEAKNGIWTSSQPTDVDSSAPDALELLLDNIR